MSTIILLLLTLCSILLPCNVNCDSKYKVVFERGEVTNFNGTLGVLGHLKFNKLNRTSFGLDVSFDLYQAMNVDLMKISAQVYKQAANDYKLYPVALTVPICAGSKRVKKFINLSNVREYTNVPFCGRMKAGHYYVNNYPFQLKAPSIIRVMSGSYKVHGVIFENSKTLLFEGDVYGKIVPIID